MLMKARPSVNLNQLTERLNTDFFVVSFVLDIGLTDTEGFSDFAGRASAHKAATHKDVSEV
jgi:hypothetical protein